MKTIRSTLQDLRNSAPWILIKPSDNQDYCILWLQGWGSTIKKHTPQITSIAKQTGVAVAMLDYAGHGSHPIPLEDTTREQQFDEVVAVFDELRAMGYKHVIVAGTSFGGYMTALLCAKRKPYAAILRAPAIYKDDEFSLAYPDRQGYRDKEYEALKFTINPTSNMAALHAIANFHGSVYVIEHEIDSVIPQNIPRAYFDVAKRGNYLVVPATDHAIAKMPEPEKHYRYITSVIGCIVELIRQEKVFN